MKVEVLRVRAWVRNMHTRMPFRYGIAEMTALPHLLLEADVNVDSAPVKGWAADHLPPKWFTKDPATSYESDVADMLAVIREACRPGGSAESAYEFWRALDARQRTLPYPALLSNFGTSLMERCVIDAVCRASGTPFWKAAGSGILGRQYALGEPSRSVALRHTVGLSDPIGDADEDHRPHDGLPYTLAECIRAYRLTHFKIKVTPATGRERLKRVLEVLPPGSRYTVDGNESFCSVEQLREFLEPVTLDGLMFVEQPFHRDVALSLDLNEWSGRPPVIIDESDTGPDAVRRALELGYAGSSYKSCKGVFAGLEKWEMALPVLSGEDLTTVGPVSLPADLAVMAALGIGNVERNGHHYFKGVDVMVQLLCEAHPDLYERQDEGFVTLRIRDGRIELGSVNSAPFGVGFDPVPEGFDPLDDWTFSSLES